MAAGEGGDEEVRVLQTLRGKICEWRRLGRVERKRAASAWDGTGRDGTVRVKPEGKGKGLLRFREASLPPSLTD